MYHPYEYWNNVPVFSSNDVDLYGPPDLYGYEDYYVIETLDSARPLIYDLQETAVKNARPIHRYSRMDRFTFTLKYLIGSRGAIPQKVLDACSQVSRDPLKIWFEIKTILKQNKWNIYYNRISIIVSHFGLQVTKNMTNKIYHQILQDFMKMDSLFNQRKRKEWNRRYFLNLKFVALKLLDHYGVTFNIKIPLIKTKRKLKTLNELWDDFY